LVLLTTFLQQKPYRHSGPSNQQKLQKHEESNSGGHHRKLRPGGGGLGQLSIIVSIAAYATITPAYPWVNTLTPGRGPARIDGGTAAQLAAELHHWEEAVVTFITWNTVEQALKKNYYSI
jgi:hypothetical protein